MTENLENEDSKGLFCVLVLDTTVLDSFLPPECYNCERT